MNSTSRLFIALVALCFLTGCVASKPAPDMSWYKQPTQGTAGIYFYQWKTGVLGAVWDVDFILDGESLGQVNTGEYLYFEVPAGKHKLRWSGGIIQQTKEVEYRKLS